MKEYLLSGENIRKEFHGNLILQGVNITVYAGDFTVIMGSSGSGKSTLLYALSGMDKISSGTLFYQGEDITNASEKELSHLRAEEFGFIFQRMHLVNNLSLYENIVVAGYIGKKYSEKEVNKRAIELMDHMNLLQVKDHLPSEVSGGQAQRAAIARAVISNPKIIFADEPTGALNRANTKEVLQLLSKLNKQGQSILLVTHDKEAALRGNRILYLEDGKIIDELKLEVYKEKDKKREERLNDWLEQKGW